MEIAIVVTFIICLWCHRSSKKEYDEIRLIISKIEDELYDIHKRIKELEGVDENARKK